MTANKSPVFAAAIFMQRFLWIELTKAYQQKACSYNCGVFAWCILLNFRINVPAKP